MHTFDSLFILVNIYMDRGCFLEIQRVHSGNRDHNEYNGYEFWIRKINVLEESPII